jgi:hypothetical protein
VAQADVPAGEYRLRLAADDWARVRIDGQVVLEETTPSWVVLSERSVQLARGKHTIEIEYYETAGWAQLLFWMERDASE